jgi:hypothetical protein
VEGDAPVVDRSKVKLPVINWSGIPGGVAEKNVMAVISIGPLNKFSV